MSLISCISFETDLSSWGPWWWWWPPYIPVWRCPLVLKTCKLRRGRHILSRDQWSRNPSKDTKVGSIACRKSCWEESWILPWIEESSLKTWWRIWYSCWNCRLNCCRRWSRRRRRVTRSNWRRGDLNRRRDGKRLPLVMTSITSLDSRFYWKRETANKGTERNVWVLLNFGDALSSPSLDVNLLSRLTGREC